MVLTERKKLKRQTVVGQAVVVTSVRGDLWETRVIGGDLDGWLLEAASGARAYENHCYVSQMVRGAADQENN